MQKKVASSCQAVLEALPRQISPTSAAFWRAAFWRAHMLRDFQALRQQYHTLPCCRRAGLRPLQRCHPARHGSLCGELCTLTCCQTLLLCLHLIYNGSISGPPPAAKIVLASGTAAGQNDDLPHCSSSVLHQYCISAALQLQVIST